MDDFLPLKETGEFVYGTNEPVFAWTSWADIADKFWEAHSYIPPTPPVISDTDLVGSLLGGIQKGLQTSLETKEDYWRSSSNTPTTIVTHKGKEYSVVGNGLDILSESLKKFDALNPPQKQMLTPQAMEDVMMPQKMSGAMNLLGW